MLKSREITPQQSATLLEFASDVRAGEFGAPVNLVDPGRSIAVYRHHLVKVADVPYFKYPDSRVIDPNQPGQLGRVTRIFRPSLETAMGLREPAALLGLSSAIEEDEFHVLTERSRLIERMRAEGLKPSEIEDDQFYDSAYAAKIGKFMTDLIVESTTVVKRDADDVPSAFEVKYELLRKEPPAAPDTLRNPSYMKGFRFPLYVREAPWRHNMTTVRIGGKSHTHHSGGRVNRFEAAAVIEDLERVKAEYAQWLLPGELDSQP